MENNENNNINNQDKNTIKSNSSTNNEISNQNKLIKTEAKKYPFIEELVDELYSKSLNELIQKHVSTPIDKKVFLMYVMMYFVIHLQIVENEIDDKKCLIKDALNDLIGNRDKRRMFIDFFDKKFQEIEFSPDVMNQINDSTEDDN